VQEKHWSFDFSQCIPNEIQGAFKMSNVVELIAISDVVLAGIINGVFWLIIFLVAIILFRAEIGLLLGSLGRFKIAGAIFELRDRGATFAYYDIFSTILVEILSKQNSADLLYDYVSESSARQLATFLERYAKKVPDEHHIEILKNVALLAGRKGYTNTAIRVYDALLKRIPHDRSLLYLKARFLRESGVPENISKSEAIYADLANKYPYDSGVWFGRARTQSS
jgi:hypothetical protein